MRLVFTASKGEKLFCGVWISSNCLVVLENTVVTIQTDNPTINRSFITIVCTMLLLCFIMIFLVKNTLFIQL